MGNLELSVKKEIRNSKIQRTVLSIIFTAGVLGVAAIAPNALQILRPLAKRGVDRNNKYRIERAVRRLEEKGLIARKKTEKGYTFELTKKGERQIDILDKFDFKFKKPKKWDGKWRIVIFDIEEKKRDSRNLLRSTLARIGFMKLQHSVWIYPYDCEDVLTLLKTHFHLGKNVLYIIADAVEGDFKAREFFEVN